MIILTLKTTEEYSVDGQVVETNTCIPMKWVVRENWQGEDLEVFDTKAEAEKFVEEYQSEKRYTGKGYVVLVNGKIASPVFGNEISAGRWIGRKTDMGGIVQSAAINGKKYTIEQIDVTLGLLQLLKLDQMLNG